METEQIWQNIAAKRRTWEPSNPEPNSEFTKYNRTISRCISLRDLEMPVKEFLQQGLDRSDINKIGEGGIQTLIRNQQDEDRHDLALTRCFNAYASYNKTEAYGADFIIKEWLSLDDHPITKAAVLENGVFFVLLPILRNYGTPSMQETSGWISMDEVLHVQSHRTAARLLGAKPSSKLNKLRKATVAWLVGRMEEEGRKGALDHYMKASDNLMKSGVSNLTETKFATKPAFFETSNRLLGKYA